MQLEGPLGLAEPAHAVEDPPGPEPLLGDHEPVAARTQQVLGRHPHVVVDHLAVPAPDAEHRRLPHDRVAGRVGRARRSSRYAEVGRHVVVLGAAHHRGVGGPVRAGGEPLVAVDHPLVAVEDRAWSAAGSGPSAPPRARSWRSSATPRPAPAAARYSLPPLVRRVLVQHERVLEREGAERDLAELAAALHLVHVHVVHERQPAAAQLGRMTQRPQPLGLGLGLQAADELPRPASPPSCRTGSAGSTRSRMNASTASRTPAGRASGTSKLI